MTADPPSGAIAARVKVDTSQTAGASVIGTASARAVPPLAGAHWPVYFDISHGIQSFKDGSRLVLHLAARKGKLMKYVRGYVTQYVALTLGGHVIG